MCLSQRHLAAASGRAGCEGPGKCFRLYPESEFGKLMDSAVPEIKRCNLSNVVLQLKALGIKDIFSFDFMEKPSRFPHSFYLSRFPVNLLSDILGCDTISITIIFVSSNRSLV
ncbi:uncharacterized protein A4U43_C09F8800 [Asparagus officinalis]|uniref:RNA helicase n=1 Tax=Asparagus officinalis TaxID=4686 RepID=A0A5P1E9K5_ASPOF|nr:uncharacterized protein A4U43_C09F8800 [Asparagus officinalis]